MPINLIPILLPLLLIWLILAFFLFRWKKLAGGLFVGLSITGLLINYAFTNVERKIDEQMAFQIIDSGSVHTIEFTNSAGEKFTVDSTMLFPRLKGRTEQKVRVLMTGWYDYGRMRAYHIQSVDGVDIRTQQANQ